MLSVPPASEVPGATETDAVCPAAADDCLFTFAAMDDLQEKQHDKTKAMTKAMTPKRGAKAWTAFLPSPAKRPPSDFQD